MGQGGDRYESGLRAGAVVGRTRKIEFRLDADFDAFGLRGLLAGARRRPLWRAFTNFVIEIQSGVRGRRFLKGKARLGIGRIGAQPTAARAILLQASRYFGAPFRLGAFGEISRADCHGFVVFFVFSRGEIAERAALCVVEQESATLRAYVNHWSVLRCGNSQWNVPIISRGMKEARENRRPAYPIAQHRYCGPIRKLPASGNRRCERWPVFPAVRGKY